MSPIMQPQPQPQPGLSAIQPHASGRPPPVVAVVVVVVDRWDKADHAEEATRCDTEEGDRPYAAQRYAVVRYVQHLALGPALEWPY